MKRKHRVDHIEKTFWDLYAFTTASLLFLKKGFWFDKTQCLDYLFVGSWKNFLWTRFHICLMVKNATTWIYFQEMHLRFEFQIPKRSESLATFLHRKCLSSQDGTCCWIIKVCRLGVSNQRLGIPGWHQFCEFELFWIAKG